MKTPILHLRYPSSPSSLFKFPQPKLTLSPKLRSLFPNPHLLFAGRLTFPAVQLTRANGKSVGMEPCRDGDGEGDCDDLVIEASLTRYLPPALTLVHGLEALMNALHEFKLNPPSSNGGLIRFQVAVPPSVNALEWFSCQPEASGVFPQFYMSKQSDNPSSNTHGVFGIGAAVHSPSNPHEWNSFRRYLLVDAPNITAYGFLGFNYHKESSSLKHETGSCCFIIPQVELNECEGFCILSGTLVWNDSLLCNFEQALHSYETSLLQAINHVPATLDTCFTNFMKSIQKFNVIADENSKMFYMEAPVLGTYNYAARFAEMVFPSS